MKKKLLVLAFFLTICYFSFSETLIMKDGTILKGTIKSMDENTIILITTANGEIKVNRKNIENIIYKDNEEKKVMPEQEIPGTESVNKNKEKIDKNRFATIYIFHYYILFPVEYNIYFNDELIYNYATNNNNSIICYKIYSEGRLYVKTKIRRWIDRDLLWGGGQLIEEKNELPVIKINNGDVIYLYSFGKNISKEVGEKELKKKYFYKNKINLEEDIDYPIIK